jgi:hypothetical protein
MFCPYFHGQSEERNIKAYLKVVGNEEKSHSSQQKGDLSTNGCD